MRESAIPLIFFGAVGIFIAASLIIFPRADHSQLRKIDWWRKTNARQIDSLREGISMELRVFTSTQAGGSVGIINPFVAQDLAKKLKVELERLSPPSPVVIVDHR